MIKTVTFGENLDYGLGLYSKDIQIISVYPTTWGSVGLYIYNGEFGVHSENPNVTLDIIIIYYDAS